MTLPLRVHLTLFDTVALIVALCAFAADVWWVEGRIGLRRVDRDLEGLSATVSTLLRHELDESVPLIPAAREISRVVPGPDRAVAFFDSGGRPIASSWNGLTRRDVLAADREVDVRSFDLERNAWRVRTERRSYGSTPISLVLAASLRDVQRQQHEVVETMWMALPLALLLAGGGGWWIATVALRPITGMARQAAQITTTGTETLRHTAHDELGTFAEAFNGLLTRLRDALRAQRQFMADASHELRTPVSVVRAAADVALSRNGRHEGEYRETLAIVGSQAQRLSRLVDSMLVLARADAGGYPIQRVDLYLDEIVGECCRAVRVSCEQRGVTMRAGPFPETAFRGDEDLLRQLVLNVLQNAVQHSPSGGVVKVDLTNTADVVSIVVGDSGAGIPAADRERIFERFVRLNAARTGGGAGLGLPIARWIAESHGGSLTLADSGPNGRVFRIDLAR